MSDRSHSWLSVLTAVLESHAETGPELEKSEVHINITAGRTAILPCMVYQMSSSNTVNRINPLCTNGSFLLILCILRCSLGSSLIIFSSFFNFPFLGQNVNINRNQ